MPRVEPTLLAAQIRRIAPDEALTDAELVGRYAEHRDAAAFEVLVWRHGPMVWATARRVLRHQQDVEDAFQATFLALARVAGTLGTRQAVAGWLHRVAMNASINLKARRRTTGLTDVPAPPEPDGELSGAVDEELERLPERMRAAFVLCCLEGMTSAEAARELGCPVGTVDSRLHAARARLRDRLTRRGFGPAAVLAATAPTATATLPTPLVAITLRHAMHTLTAPNNINLLATGALKAMFASKLKTVAALLFVALVVGGGLAHLSGQQKDVRNAPGTQKEAPMNPVRPPDDWSKAVNGLQVRVVLIEKPRSNVTRMLHPYLELHNVDDMAYPLKVRLGGARHVKFELVDADGKVVDDGQRGARDGHYPDPGTVSLPLDSSLRVNMHCTNWGIPENAAAMIATDSGAWVLKPEQEGKVFLRATVAGKKDADGRVWSGELEAKVRVAWSGDDTQIALRREGHPRAILYPDKAGPKPVIGRLSVNSHGMKQDTQVFSVGLELDNMTGREAILQFDPKDLKLELLDAKGKVMEEGPIGWSGPAPMTHRATLPTSGYVGLSTYRGGIGLRPKSILLAAGLQAWVLKPGTYRVRGTATVSVTFGDKVLDPEKPDVPEPKPGTPQTLKLDLIECRFELKMDENAPDR